MDPDQPASWPTRVHSVLHSASSLAHPQNTSHTKWGLPLWSLSKCSRSLWSDSVDPDQSAHVVAAQSGSTLFGSTLEIVSIGIKYVLRSRLKQKTLLRFIFCQHFKGLLDTHRGNNVQHDKGQIHIYTYINALGHHTHCSASQGGQRRRACLQLY